MQEQISKRKVRQKSTADELKTETNLILKYLEQIKNDVLQT